MLQEIIRTHNLKVDENRVRALIIEIASAYENPNQVIALYFKKKELMNNIRNIVLEELAIEAVITKAKITEKPFKFNELIYHHTYENQFVSFA
ncbi:trigger factor [Candidatus Pantoea carbekii]|uniref:Trigger factor n=1 Tax=Candidatus Pantoea carbekii TaxID=1235990 RepID=U3U3L2_9GAMM|nr:trigger factor [Candidatus Pantoea carbekii]